MGNGPCPILGDSAPCPECGTPLHYHVVDVDTVGGEIYRVICLQCRRLTMSYFVDGALPPNPLHCKNCGRGPHVHAHGRCLFGPGTYAPDHYVWRQAIAGGLSRMGVDYDY